MTRCIVAILAAFLIQQGTSGRDAPQSVTVEGARLTGTLLSDDGKPVYRAMVTILGSDGPALRASVTNAAGEFSIAGLPAGSFALWASKPGFVTSYYGSRRAGRGPAIPVALAGGQHVTVSMTMLRGASIAGRIADPFGRPLAQVSVQARPASPAGTAAGALLTAKTDGQGGYRIFGLAPGEYIVEALPPPQSNSHAVLVTDDEVKWALQQAQQGSIRSGSGAVAPAVGPAVAYAPTFFPGAAVRDQATPVALGPGEQRADVTFNLQLLRAARISGRVVVPGGQPMAGISLALVPSEPASTPSQGAGAGATAGVRVPVSDTGEFSAAGVVPGVYALWARTALDTSARALDASAVTLWAHNQVIVNGFDVAGVVLSLQPGARVSGTVRFEGPSPTPAPGSVRIILSPQFGNGVPFIGSRTAPPDASGRFLVPDVPPGPYQLRIAAGSVAGSQPEPWALESATVAGHDVADGTLVVREGDEISGVAVTLTNQETEISGTLFDAARRPTAQFSLLFFSVDRAHWTDRSRRVRTVQPAMDGTFRVKGLPPGDYFAVADATVDAGTVVDAAYLEQLAGLASRLTLAPGEKRRVDFATTTR